ncbi:MAG TPA: ABC transporter [Lachnospiraceae bacterium]|nr:ABC transporter [Lachnospiraceae bacterium]
MILACDHLDKMFGDKMILKDASFHIEDKQKYALIGINGAGKTTLLRMIIGEEPLDGGNVTKNREATIGYLPQQLGYHSDKTIYDELYGVRDDIISQEKRIHELEELIAGSGNTTGDSLGKASNKASGESLLETYHRLQTDFELNDGYAYPSKVMGVINGLGLGDGARDKIINELSGGQKTRVALGKLLLKSPDLLILDEPTNHLDIASIRWLEDYLYSYPGAVLIVSHDRYFLDRFTDQVWELERGTLRNFKGNYTAYIRQKDVLKTTLKRAYEKQTAEVKHQKAVIEKLRSFNREKSIRRAESREKLLSKMELMDDPDDVTASMHLKLEPAVISGKDVLSLKSLKKCFGDNCLFSDTDLEVRRGEKIAIIGDNGTGKTTLLNMIRGNEPFDNGTITLGTGVEIGYYDQEHGILHEDKTVFDELQDDYPYLDDLIIRNTLAAFLFTGDDVFKNISMLSGGERGRVSLAKLMLSEANLLLLDEPTNHLDVVSREVLENAINEYSGTVICVSHDRYFIDKTATRIWELKNARFYDYSGGYSYYLEKCELTSAPNDISASGSAAANSTHGMAKPAQKSRNNASEAAKSNAGDKLSNKESWLADKQRQTEQRRLERECAAAEARVEELENALAEIDTKLSSPDICTDIEALTHLTAEREKTDTALNEAMSEWESLSEALEEFA